MEVFLESFPSLGVHGLVGDVRVLFVPAAQHYY